MQVRFIEHVETDGQGGQRRGKQERVEVANGDYRRTFEGREKDVRHQAGSSPMLKRAGEFELVEEKPAPPPPPHGAGKDRDRPAHKRREQRRKVTTQFLTRRQ